MRLLAWKNPDPEMREHLRVDDDTCRRLGINPVRTYVGASVGELRRALFELMWSEMDAAQRRRAP